MSPEPTAASILSGAASHTKAAPDKKTEVPFKTKQTCQLEKPKRPLSAYNLFFQQERDRLLRDIQSPFGFSHDANHCTLGRNPSKRSDRSKKSRPPPHGKFGFAELTRTIGARWKSADERTKEYYNRLAEQEKERYRSELEIWKSKGSNGGEKIRAQYLALAPSANLALSSVAMCPPRSPENVSPITTEGSVFDHGILSIPLTASARNGYDYDPKSPPPLTFSLNATSMPSSCDSDYEASSFMGGEEVSLKRHQQLRHRQNDQQKRSFHWSAQPQATSMCTSQFHHGYDSGKHGRYHYDGSTCFDYKVNTKSAVASFPPRYYSKLHENPSPLTASTVERHNLNLPAPRINGAAPSPLIVDGVFGQNCDSDIGVDAFSQPLILSGASPFQHGYKFEEKEPCEESVDKELWRETTHAVGDNAREVLAFLTEFVGDHNLMQP